MLPEMTPNELSGVTLLVYRASASPALMNELRKMNTTGSRLTAAATAMTSNRALYDMRFFALAPVFVMFDTFSFSPGITNHRLIIVD